MSFLRSPLLPIFLIVVVDILGLAIILPLLPFYAEHLGASPMVVGALVTVYAACQLVAGPVLGRISDRVGRRPVLLVSQAGTFISLLVLGRAEALWVVFLARMVDGFTAGNLSLAQAYISDVTPAHDRARAFGLIGVAFGIGFLFGPAISGYLSQYGVRLPIHAAAGLSLASMICTYSLLPRGAPGRHGGASPPLPTTGFSWRGIVQYFHRPSLAPLFWQFALFCFGFSLFTSGFALFAERRFAWEGRPFGPQEVGYVFAYVGSLGIVLQGGFIKTLVRWLGEPRLARLGFAAMAAGFAILAGVRSVPGLLTASAIASLGSGALRPTLTSLITQRAGRNEQGAVLGASQSVFSLAQIVSPLVAGFVIERRWLALWAVLIAGTSMAGAFLPSRESKGG